MNLPDVSVLLFPSLAVEAVDAALVVRSNLGIEDARTVEWVLKYWMEECSEDIGASLLGMRAVP